MTVCARCGKREQTKGILNPRDFFVLVARGAIESPFSFRFSMVTRKMKIGKREINTPRETANVPSNVQDWRGQVDRVAPRRQRFEIQEANRAPAIRVEYVSSRR